MRLARLGRSRLFAASFVIVIEILLPSGEVFDTVRFKPATPYSLDLELCKRFAAEAERDLNSSGPNPYRRFRYECKQET